MPSYDASSTEEASLGSSYLERLASALGCYETPSGSPARDPVAAFLARESADPLGRTVVQSFESVLALPDEEFFAEDADVDARSRSGTSSQVERELEALENAIFMQAPEDASTPDGVSAQQLDSAVREAIEAHVAARGGGDSVRMETVARLRGRIATLRDRQYVGTARQASYESMPVLPSLPDVAPSIHDHEAYREYVRLRKAHSRRRRAANGSTS